MGNWNISIEGVGCHHNEDCPKDANKMAEQFVDELKKAGHSITWASFTYGGAEETIGAWRDLPMIEFHEEPLEAGTDTTAG